MMMKTQINTVHEEKYSDGSRILGVLANYSIDGSWKDSLIYIYRNNVYIFFTTIVDMIDYLMYADKKTLRAYMEESEFDKFFDSDEIDGEFKNVLRWVKE